MNNLRGGYTGCEVVLPTHSSSKQIPLTVIHYKFTTAPGSETTAQITASWVFCTVIHTTNIFRRNCCFFTPPLLDSSVPLIPFLFFLNSASFQCRTKISHQRTFFIHFLWQLNCRLRSVWACLVSWIVIPMFLILAGSEGLLTETNILLSTELTLTLMCLRKTLKSYTLSTCRDDSVGL